MGCNHAYKHTENGLIQEKFLFYRTGFEITISISTGINGEAACLIIRDHNLYPDGDSRSERPSELIIPIDDAEDLNDLCKVIKRAMGSRKRTLITKKSLK